MGSKENLIVYREIAMSLAYAHMNHEQRAKQLEVLADLLQADRQKWGECDYRNTLDSLIALLDYGRRTVLTHSGVKSLLHLFVTVAQNAISRPHSLWEERENEDHRHEVFETFTAMIAPTEPDEIPF